MSMVLRDFTTAYGTTFWICFTFSIICFVAALLVEDAHELPLETRYRLRLIFRSAGSLLLIVAIFMGMKGCSKSGVTKLDNEYHKETILDREIYSLTNGNMNVEGEGHFYRGTGSFIIVSSETYRYYYKEGERFLQGNVPAEQTYIEYIADGEQPRITGYHEWEIEFYEYNGIVKGRCYNKKPYRVNERTYYVVYVPEGSIVESFNLN